MFRDTRDDRAETRRGTPDRPADGDRATHRVDVPREGLALPPTDRREVIEFRDRVYHLRGSQSRILATVGAFRVVPATDLTDSRSSPNASTEDLRRLSAQGLIERRTILINHQPTRVVFLTPQGRALLESRRSGPSEGRSQRYHAGLVKPRELAHDAQLYRVFQAEASRLEDSGARITRVVLDCELKREYQTFLNRPDRPDDEDAYAATRAFAAASHLPVIDGHLELPDLRVEYETEDGRFEVRDVELVTEHYSRGQLTGKARAGFALYRAAGAGRARGGTPFDPQHLERL